MNRLIVFIILCMTFMSSFSQQKISLSGDWAFALDPNDVGITEQWFERTLTSQIKLPGSLQEQGFGFDVDVNTI